MGRGARCCENFMKSSKVGDDGGVGGVKGDRVTAMQTHVAILVE